MATKRASKKVQKQSTKSKVRVSQSSIAGPVMDAVERVATQLDLAAALDPSVAKALGAVVATTPTTLVEQVAATADRHGALMGTVFPSDEARVTIAYAAAFEPVVTVMSDVSLRLSHDILVKRAEMAKAALASYAALRGVVRTPAGKPMKAAYEKMRLIMKEHHKGSGKRKKKGDVAAEGVNATTSGTTTNGATTTEAPKNGASSTVGGPSNGAQSK